jgi:hypothetical protein
MKAYPGIFKHDVKYAVNLRLNRYRYAIHIDDNNHSVEYHQTQGATNPKNMKNFKGKNNIYVESTPQKKDSMKSL